MDSHKITNAQKDNVYRTIAPAQTAEAESTVSADLEGNGPGYGKNASGAKAHPHLAGKPALDGAPNSPKAQTPSQLSVEEAQKAVGEQELTPSQRLENVLGLGNTPSNAPTPSPMTAPAA